MDMPEPTPSPPPNLQYVSDMLGQLKVVAGTQGGPFLAYLLDLAAAEAGRLLAHQSAYPGSDTRPSE